METTEIPKGYAEDASGRLIPLNKIKQIDKDRQSLVTKVCEAAKEQQKQLLAFKTKMNSMVSEFVGHSLSAYKVQYGGSKGNITLISFDGRYKIVKSCQDSIRFDERLQAAKILIDECIQAWSKGSNNNIKVLVGSAFQVDKSGKINTSRVLGLRKLKIEDPKWERAMQAIDDSILVTSSKEYIRFYERDDTGGYQAISLDIAGL